MVSQECKNDNIERQFKKIGSAFIGQCVVGAPKSVMRLHSMWLLKKKGKVTFVSSNCKDERISLPKYHDKIEQTDKDVAIFMTSLNDQYAAHAGLCENVCFAKFDVIYDTLYGAPADSETLSYEITKENQNDAAFNHHNSGAEFSQK